MAKSQARGKAAANRHFPAKMLQPQLGGITYLGQLGDGGGGGRGERGGGNAAPDSDGSELADRAANCVQGGHLVAADARAAHNSMAAG